MGVKLTPVERRAKQRLFLAALRRTGLKLLAAKTAGVHPSTPFAWAARDDRFAEKAAEAQALGSGVRLARLEREVHRRALAGTKDQGSILALMFETKRHDPAYRENAGVQVLAQGPVMISLSLDPTPGPGLAAGVGGMPALVSGEVTVTPADRRSARHVAKP